MAKISGWKKSETKKGTRYHNKEHQVTLYVIKPTSTRKRWLVTAREEILGRSRTESYLFKTKDEALKFSTEYRKKHSCHIADQPKKSASKTKNGKIPVKKLILLWYEGRQMDAYPENSEFKSIKAMNEFLARQSRKASKEGGYDKHKIQIIWEDGQEYTGRWDVTNPNSEYYHKDDVMIGLHIKNWLKYLMKQPDTTLKEKKEYQEFLNKYDLED